MPATIPLRSDISAEELRRLARKSRNSRQCRRFLSLAVVAEGGSRSQAAQTGDVTVQVIRDWVVRFNAQGPGGLIDRKSTGQPPKLNPEQQQALARRVEEGASFERDGVVRWRRSDLVAWVLKTFGVKVSETTMSNYLRRLGFSYMSGRPRSPKQDKQEIETFKKTSPKSWKRSKKHFLPERR